MELERLTLTVEEAGELLGISRALAYEMARTGRLPTFHRYASFPESGHTQHQHICRFMSDGEFPSWTPTL